MAVPLRAANASLSAANPDLHCRMNYPRATTTARARRTTGRSSARSPYVNGSTCGCSKPLLTPWRAEQRPQLRRTQDEMPLLPWPPPLSLAASAAQVRQAAPARLSYEEWRQTAR